MREVARGGGGRKWAGSDGGVGGSQQKLWLLSQMGAEPGQCLSRGVGTGPDFVFGFDRSVPLRAFDSSSKIRKIEAMINFCS